MLALAGSSAGGYGHSLGYARGAYRLAAARPIVADIRIQSKDIT